MAKLKVRPLLVHLFLLAVDDLLDLLCLLMGLEKLPRAQRLCITELLGAGQDNVENGRDVVGRRLADEAVHGVRVPARDGLTVDMRGTRHLDTEGRLVDDAGLDNGILQRHDGWRWRSSSSSSSGGVVCVRV